MTEHVPDSGRHRSTRLISTLHPRRGCAAPSHDRGPGRRRQRHLAAERPRGPGHQPPSVRRLLSAVLPLAFAAHGPARAHRAGWAGHRTYLDTRDRSFLDWGACAVEPGGGSLRLTKYDNDVRGNLVKPRPPRFTGRVWVLVGAANSSATFEFAQAVQQNRLGTLVGQPTGGNQRGINGGAFFFTRLPRTRRHAPRRPDHLRADHVPHEGGPGAGPVRPRDRPEPHHHRRPQVERDRQDAAPRDGPPPSPLLVRGGGHLRDEAAMGKMSWKEKDRLLRLLGSAHLEGEVP